MVLCGNKGPLWIIKCIPSLQNVINWCMLHLSAFLLNGVLYVCPKAPHSQPHCSSVPDIPSLWVVFMNLPATVRKEKGLIGAPPWPACQLGSWFPGAHFLPPITLPPYSFPSSVNLTSWWETNSSRILASYSLFSFRHLLHFEAPVKAI